MLTVEQAEKELAEALCWNPGKWGGYSYSVANYARRITEKVIDSSRSRLGF